ncbi:acyl-CoA dehydrogenase family protein [Desulfosarcina sp. OttesenSCG-928-A07]|nr:acyl-CoA dehydrogenase family protein [Desulfosarcina sp. OttesenSCG-928-G17]MDL2328966.1 acyl-CoA dehydrogenase family protein [Desulfosarcina sp. OttesenSCG-928-A07]
MDFGFGEKAEAFRKEIRRFVADELPADHIGLFFTEEHFDAHWAFSMEIARKLAKKGWLTLSWPKAYGGIGADFWEQIVFAEEVGYWGIPGTGMGVSGTAWVGPTLMLYGTDAQKQKYLPPIAAGADDGVWCTGYSEPDAGSDLASLQTTALKNKDHYVINGQKVWTSAAHRARWCWLACRTDPHATKKHHGISIIIVDLKSPGVTIRPIPNLVGQHYFNEIFFSDVVVPVENRVGPENEGWKVIMKALSFERGIAVRYGARLWRVLEELFTYVRSEGYMENPLVRQRLSGLAVDIHALRLNAYETAWKQYTGKTIIYEPARDKASLDELMERVGRVGTELLGAYSQIDPSREHRGWARVKSAVENIYWAAPGLSIAAGTTDTMRNIVARFGLQLPVP